MWKPALLLALGLAAALTLPAEERWQADLDKFLADQKATNYKPGGTVFIGSSSIRMWDLEKSFPGKGYVNRGFGGSQMFDAVRLADRILLPLKPKTVLVYEGDNDINSGKSALEVAGDYQRFVDLVHAKLPETKIVFIPIKPSLARWELVDEMRTANMMIRSISERDPRLEYADIDGPMLGADNKPRPELFRDDGLHMTDAGYVIWTDVVSQYLD